MSNTLPIHERFLSFQGEGEHMGRRAFFIRTFGCPVHCPWCDSAGTWHKDWVPKTINRMSIEALVGEAIMSKAEFVVITGGEPTVHPNLEDLALALLAAGISTHLETCGAFEFNHNAFDWITVSPKWDKPPIASVLERADELKIIVEHKDSIKDWLLCLQELAPGFIDLKPLTVWLHPEWSQRNNPEVLNAITKSVVLFGDPFRAGYQLHKLYLADATDARAVSSAPLGGNLELGAST